MSGEVEFTQTDENEFRPPMVVRLWKEGRRLVEINAISIEYDGEVIEIFTDESERTWEDTEWDELTVQYED